MVFRSVTPRYASSHDLLSGYGARKHGGRWNPPGFFPAIYASLAPETALAEAESSNEAGTSLENVHEKVLDMPVFLCHPDGMAVARHRENPRKEKSERPTLVREVRHELGVDRRIFSRMTGYSERAIANWESGKALSDSSRQRIAEMRRLRKALSRVLKPTSIPRWLETPNKAFRGLKPLEAIERGEIDLIWRMIFYLESGVAS